LFFILCLFRLAGVFSFQFGLTCFSYRKTWHQMLQKLLDEYTGAVLHGCFRLPTELANAAVVKTFGAYALSALLYRWTDYAAGVQADESGAVRFFMLHAVAVLAEKALAEHMNIPDTRLGRVVGYVWTTFFFVWTLPSWIFPWTRLA
jgi:hypothetical protein